MFMTWIGVTLQVLHCFYGHSPLVAMGKKCFIHTLRKQNVSKMFPFHFRQKITSTLLPLCMLAIHVVLEYWSRPSPRITLSQTECPAWGHPQWFVWSEIAFTGETRKYSFPQCLTYGIPHPSKAPEKTSGLLSALDFPPSLSCFALSNQIWIRSLSVTAVPKQGHICKSSLSVPECTLLCQKNTRFMSLRFVTRWLLFCFPVMTRKLAPEKQWFTVTNMLC